jgi:hypothetical protein
VPTCTTFSHMSYSISLLYADIAPLQSYELVALWRNTSTLKIDSFMFKSVFYCISAESVGAPWRANVYDFASYSVVDN